MKKSILAIAVASMAVSTAALAEPTVYGNIHLSINKFDKDDGTGAKTSGELDMSSNTSAIGVKGSEDLGDGLKAIYKAEFQLDAADGGWSSVSGVDTSTTPPEASTSSNGGALTQRDVFAGLKGGWGAVKLGTMSSNYKQMGGKVDSLYRTPAEGRGFIETQSSQLHGGRGVNRGRQTNTLQYVTPKMAGVQLVANTTFSGADDKSSAETSGVGIRWSNKAFLVYADWIDGANGDTDTSGNAVTESATKVGGKWTAKAFFIGAQYEDADKRTGSDYTHVNGGWLINKNNALVATYGTKAVEGNSAADTTGMAIAYNHNLSKMTNVYVAYMDKSSDTAALEDSAFALGFKKKF